MKIDNFKKAFSLVEMSIVLVIVACLVAVIASSNRLIDNSRIATAQSLTKTSPVTDNEGLVLWLETTMSQSFADSEADNGKVITTWFDLGPEKINATAGDSPKYLSKGINNLPVVTFNGTSNYLNFDGSILVNTNYTVFIVEQRRSANPGFFIGGSNGAANQMLDVGYYGAGITFDQWYGAPVFTVTAYTSPIPRIHSIVHSSIYGQLYYINGTAQTVPSGSTYTTHIGSFSGAVIGNLPANPNFYTGDIGEIIIFNKDLNDYKRKDIEQYLSKKWGILLS